MRELTQEKLLEMMCAPEATDAPEELDFVESDEAGEVSFVESWITKELN